MFGDLDNVATSTLESILNKAKEVNTSAWSPENVKEYKEAIDKLYEKINKRNPFRALKESWQKLVNGLKTNNNDLTTEGVNGLKNATEELGSTFESVFSSIESTLGESGKYTLNAIKELTSGTQEMQAAMGKILEGDIIGAIISAVDGVIKTITAVFRIAKTTRETNEKVREESQKYYYDALLQGEREYQMLVRERLRLEQQIGETTLEYQKRITSELEKQQNSNTSDYADTLKQLQNMNYVAGESSSAGTWFRKAKTTKVYGKLSGKTYDELERLYEKGMLEEEASDLFEQLKKLKEEGEDIDAMLLESEQVFKEALSGLTFDGMRDSFKEFMEDGKIEASETADYMEQVFRNAIINSLMVNQFDALLEDLTNRIQASVADGTFEQSYEGFKAEAAAIGQQMNDALSVYSGIFEGIGDSQDASSSGFETMSQDTADELNGRFTALQIYGADIVKLTGLMQLDILGIKQSSLLTAESVLEIRDISLTGLEHLAKIAKNTNELYLMNDRLDKIEINTRNL